MLDRNFFLTDKELELELDRCEYCAEKPCKDGCPADCSAAEFIMAVKMMRDEDIRRSAAHILEFNPLGGVCGVVCPDRHCMAKCPRKDIDGAILIPEVQATIVAKAKAMELIPAFDPSEPNGRSVAIIGAGPAGLSAAAMLSQKGYRVDLYDRNEEPGGACRWIPDSRLPSEVLETDIEFLLELGSITFHGAAERDANDPTTLLDEHDHEAVIVATGLPQPIQMGIRNEELAVYGTDYLDDPLQYDTRFMGKIAVIGGGAIATDCAITLKSHGTECVEMFALENWSEMPLTKKERALIEEYCIDVDGRIKVTALKRDDDGAFAGLETIKISLPPDAPFSLGAISDVDGTDAVRDDIDDVIIAIGNRAGLDRIEHERVFYAGDCVNGPTTVVEAVAAGKNAAVALDAALEGIGEPLFESAVKSHEPVDGYDHLPVPVSTTFFGREIRSPFLLSAAPPSDGYEQMKLAYEAGWAGGIMKTAFDDVPIHIPGEYMTKYDDSTFGNCDNVSGHALDRVCGEVRRLVEEYPDRLTMASTGGPVTGDDEADKAQWQSNTKKLEDAGAMGIEYSLSCPQGGEGTEGDIVSQSAPLTAKIIDWVMEVSDPDVPKLFKLTGAVTSIMKIMRAIKGVFDRYPEKKAGVTLANTFPVLSFREGKNDEGDDAAWDEAILFGMSGEGVLPISYNTLASVAGAGVTVSGNGGVMDYIGAANFLALGTNSVQVCTIVEKYGYGIHAELCEGLSHLMKARGFDSVEALIGYLAPDPVTDFMDLSPEKKISSVDEDICVSCGNCTRCPYLAIELDEEKHPLIDAELCIGCGMCTLRCPSGALTLRERTEEEAAALKED